MPTKDLKTRRVVLASVWHCRITPDMGILYGTASGRCGEPAGTEVCPKELATSRFTRGNNKHKTSQIRGSLNPV